MNPDTLQMELTKQLRKMGAKSIDFTGAAPGYFMSIEFFPETAVVDTSPSMPKTLDLGSPEMCPCTHDETEHSGGVCLLGCNVELCNPPKKSEDT